MKGMVELDEKRVSALEKPKWASAQKSPTKATGAAAKKPASAASRKRANS